MSDSTAFKPGTTSYRTLHPKAKKTTEEPQQAPHTQVQQAEQEAEEISAPLAEQVASGNQQKPSAIPQRPQIAASTPEAVSTTSTEVAPPATSHPSDYVVAPVLASEQPRTTLAPILQALGETLDSNTKLLLSEVGRVQGELQHFIEKIGRAISREHELKAELDGANAERQKLISVIESLNGDLSRLTGIEEQFEKIARTMSREHELKAELDGANAERQKLTSVIESLNGDVSRLTGIKEQFDSLVPASFQPLLDGLDQERKGFAYAMLHLLNEYTNRGPNPQLLVELTAALGTALHESPQPSSDALDTGADALNQLFQHGGDTLITVRRIRVGDPIEPALMDGAELQGKRSVAETKNWAVLSGERVIRKAQISGI